MSSVETEIKLPASDPASAAALLEHAGFVVHHPRTFESNTLLDTPDIALRRTRRILRIRQYGAKHVITYKGAGSDGKHKTREELEFEIPPGAPLPLIFERLGYTPQFRYEKYRTEYAREGEPGIATLDETPIGTYVELEGPPEWIDRTAAELGYVESDYIAKSYGALYAEHCAVHHTDPNGMVFGPEEIARRAH
ncbi:MAG: class IV adenylate cyclase [Bryobacterales bacterium]|nr:class IV adenylate cyclase [Bryobacterales bacterium]